MKCLVYGLACDEQNFNLFIERNPNPYSVAHYTFEISLLKEMSNNKDLSIDHNYILQEHNKKLRKSIIHTKKVNLVNTIDTTYLNYLNLPLIKFITLFVSAFFRTLKYCKKYKKDKIVILSTINYFPVSLANYLVSKMCSVKNVIILTDCTDSHAFNRTDKKRSIRNIYKKLTRYLEINYDAYIFFSEPMNDFININDKPFCVMEGMFNSNGLNFSSAKKANAVMYAGSLQEHLGIDNLIEAFKLITIPNLELWIFGEGDYKSHLVSLAQNKTNIKFFGFCDRQYLFEYEKKAKLLVNVRDPELSYTRYSFPSKTFEYMASGTPVLMTKIDSLKSEYYPYLFLIKSNDIYLIKNKIEDIFINDDVYLDEFGKKAQTFIFENKTATIQTEKVVNFLKNLK